MITPFCILSALSGAALIARHLHIHHPRGGGPSEPPGRPLGPVVVPPDPVEEQVRESMDGYVLDRPLIMRALTERELQEVRHRFMVSNFRQDAETEARMN